MGMELKVRFELTKLTRHITSVVHLAALVLQQTKSPLQEANKSKKFIL